MRRESMLVLAGMCLVAGTYGLVRLAYGLFLPDIQESLPVDAALAGQVAAGASVAYCAGALTAALAGSRPRLLVLGATLTASLGAAAMALAADLTLFVPAAIISSVGAGLASPGLVAVVERNVSPGRTDRAQAKVNAGTGPGLVAAGLVALVLLPDWRLGLGISAVLTALAGVGVLLLDRPDTVGRPTPTDWRPPGRATYAGLVVPAAAALLLGAGTAAVWTYGRAQVVAGGANDSVSTLAWVVLGLGGTVSALTARPLSSWHPARAWLLTAAATATATGVLGVAAHSLTAALVACAVFGWGFVAATSALISWAARVVPGQAAQGTSILFITLVLGQAAGAFAGGLLADQQGLPTVFVCAAAVTALGACLGLSRVTNTEQHDPDPYEAHSV